MPSIAESPVSIECRVRHVEELGSHHMFVADVAAVSVDDSYMDEHGTFRLSQAQPLCYSHGEYYGLGTLLGSFGYSVRKPAQTHKSKPATEKRLDYSRKNHYDRSK